MTGLTTILQSKLDKINSFVRLLTSQDTTFKMNFNDWSFAELNSRSIQVCNVLDSDEKLLQLTERDIIAGQITTPDLINIAFIIDCWLSKNQTVVQLKDSYNNIHVSEKYSNLLTLNINELLEKRWTSEYERIKKQETLFNADLFLAIKKRLFNLFPFFSHDNLWFSNIIELPNDKFKTPIVFCNKETFEIGITLFNSESNNPFTTTDIDVAVDKILELLPKDFEETRNPLTT